MRETQARLRCAALCVLSAIVPGSVEAQDVAACLEQLALLVKAGDSVMVTDATGEEIQGTIAELSSSHLVLLVAGSRIDLQEDRIRTIRRRHRDSRRNGTLWGFAVGGGLGVWVGTSLAAEYEEVGAGSVIATSAFFGAIGSGIGFLVDAMMVRDRTIYARPGGSARAIKVAVAPVLNTRRTGISVSLSF